MIKKKDAFGSHGIKKYKMLQKQLRVLQNDTLKITRISHMGTNKIIKEKKNI